MKTFINCIAVLFLIVAVLCLIQAISTNDRQAISGWICSLLWCVCYLLKSI